MEKPNYKAMNAADFLQAVGMDGQKWADAYIQIWPNGCSDHATMIGWFANAIMAGYDFARQQTEMRPPRS